MRLVTTALLALSTFAQDLPLIRGNVVEYGTTPPPNPLVGAEVILHEFVTVDGVYSRRPVATVVTDNRGGFSIKPDHAGTYFIETKKATYLTAEDLDGYGPLPCCFVAESSLLVEAGKPVDEFHFTLVRPGSISGRVIDEQDKPVAKLSLSTVGVGRAMLATTAADGTYTFRTVLPGPTKIRVGPEDRVARPLTRFTKEDLEVTEEDIETSFWPGGATEAKFALPITVIPGTTVSMPTIRARNTPYYRALLHFDAGCKRPRFIGFTDGSAFMPGFCDKDLLLAKLSSGSRVLAVWEPVPEATTDISSWALIPLAIRDHNIEVGAGMQPSVEVRGRFFAKNSDQVPEIGNTRVSLKPVDVTFLNRTFDAQANGAAFGIPRVAWPRHTVTVTLGNPNLVVKEMRYAGQVVQGGVISIVPGATLDVIVESK
jgi:hypothetical protein